MPTMPLPLAISFQQEDIDFGTYTASRDRFIFFIAYLSLRRKAIYETSYLRLNPDQVCLTRSQPVPLRTLALRADARRRKARGKEVHSYSWFTSFPKTVPNSVPTLRIKRHHFVLLGGSAEARAKLFVYR